MAMERVLTCSSVLRDSPTPSSVVDEDRIGQGMCQHGAWHRGGVDLGQAPREAHFVTGIPES